MTELFFLEPAEAELLAAIADRILPADEDGPGAAELGFVAFVDRQLASPWGAGAEMYRSEPYTAAEDAGHGWQSRLTPAQAYRAALAWLESAARDAHGEPFTRLPPPDRDRLLRRLEAGEAQLEGLAPGELFELLRRSVLEAALSDPRHGGNRDGAGWRWVGFPGPGS